MYKISVIIPVYNTEKFLNRCLESITNQTLSDIEIICINDYSTDNSLNILNKFADNDNRIKIINFETNRGASVARNKGIEIAQGEYIGFVDSDDFIDLDFYETLYNKAIESNFEVVKANIKGFNTQNEKYIKDFYDKNYLIRKNKNYFLYGFTSAIYKKSFLKDFEISFPENLIILEDPIFSIKVILNCSNIAIIDNVNYYYCDNEKSVTNQLGEEHFNSTLKAVDYILKLIEPIKNTKEYFIIVDFIISQILCWVNKENTTSLINNKAADKLAEILSVINIKEYIPFHFQEIRCRNNENKMKILRRNIRSHNA